MVKFLILDVDGTLTDGKIYMGPSGEAIKAFDVKDGCGIKDILPQQDIIPIVITARVSDMLQMRCKELGINELYQGIRNKYAKVISILDKYSDIEGRKYTLKDCAYIGDDILDLHCMKPIKEAGGVIGCPADAIDGIKAIAHYISPYNGGNGAVRSFIDYLIESNVVEDISERIRNAIATVGKMADDSLEVGRYELEEGSFFMVQEYETKNISECMVESHKKYVDVQWILSGQEAIDTALVDNLSIEKEYDTLNDYMLWKKPSRMQRTVLKENSYIILYPENAHMPCIAVNHPEKVKKIVIKIKI